MIYKIGLVIAVVVVAAYLFWSEPATESPKVPLGPPDTKLLEAYALLNSSCPMRRRHVLGSWLSRRGDLRVSGVGGLPDNE